MITLRKSIVVAAFAAIGLGLSGCPALMVPSLAYQGYKYENKDSSGQNSQSDSSQKKSSSQQQQVPDSDIE